MVVFSLPGKYNETMNDVVSFQGMERIERASEYEVVLTKSFLMLVRVCV